MELLPKWVIPSVSPAVHDLESDTVIEQTAKAYAAMNNLISEYNNFADTVNEQLTKFTSEESEARKDFECKITKVVRHFMGEVEKKFSVGIEDIVREVVAEGVTVKEDYDPDTESLNIVGGATE